MKHLLAIRGVLATATALCVLSVAACSNEQPLLSGGSGVPLLDGVSGHQDDAGTATTTTTSTPTDSVGRGPGTIGSGH